MRIRKLKRKAYTLIEVLIAASIFAIVMVMATASISQTSMYQAKLRESRKTSDEVRKVADMLTRDIKKASKDYSKSINSATYERGIVLLNCSWPTSCTSYADAPTTTENANVLIISSKDKLMAYASKDGKLYYGEDLPQSSVDVAGILDLVTKTDKVISNPDVFTSVQFAGFAPSTSSTTLAQPYISFTVVSKSNNYNSLDAGMRAISTIHSSTTVRNYK